MMNEAEIRSKIIDPLLSDLGIEPTNVSLEKTFTIKIGRHNEKIGWEEHTFRPRYDYLIKDDNKNLFIIEAKREKTQFSDEDLEQGLCYAKLVDPVAPFVLLTNGEETKIYETLTKKNITGKPLNESDYALNNYTIDLDVETKQLALLALFSLNYESFSNFCKKQSLDTISRLSGSSHEPGNLKSYIPDVFVKRHNLESKLHTFINSKNTCFMISGKSGIGKTNAMCDFVNEIQNRFLVLFYNGGQISDKLENEIAEDLNWEFSTGKSPQFLFKQIDTICKKHQQTLLIFLDGIDEWKLDSASISISKFVGHIIEKDIKLIVSCKDSKISEYLTNSGNMSILSQNLYVTNDQTMDQSFNLSKFSYIETIEAVRKYSKYFKLTGFTTTSEMFSACSDPFILRVIGEVYRNDGVPNSLSSTQIYLKYLDLLYNKNPSQKIQIRTALLKIAKKILILKNDSVLEGELEILDNDAFTFLIDYGVLISIQDKVGRHSIEFSFDGLRNYLIIYHILKLDQSTLEEFNDTITNHIDTKFGYGLFRWFKDSTSGARLEILQDKISLWDMKLVSQYLEQFIVRTESRYPFIKQRLYPNGKLGLLVLYNKTDNHAIRFGFRKYNNSDEQIIWKDITNVRIGDDELNRLMQQYNVSRLSSYSRDLSNSPLEEFVEIQIFRIIKEILLRRQLDEHNSLGISQEKFFASLYAWGDLLEMPVTYDTENNVLPLDLTRLNDKLLSLFPNHPRDVYYNMDVNSNDFIVLLNSFDNLHQQFDTITSTVLPHCDDLDYPSRYIKPSAEYFTKDGLLDYVTEFFKKFIQEYKNIVETNFPTLKDRFEIYQKLPVYVIAQITKSNSEKGNGLRYAICKNDGSDNEFEIRDYDDEKIQINHHGNISVGFCIRTKKGVKHTFDYYSSMDIFSLFHPVNSKFSNCPLTVFVYKQVESDLDKIFNPNNLMYDRFKLVEDKTISDPTSRNLWDEAMTPSI